MAFIIRLVALALWATTVAGQDDFAHSSGRSRLLRFESHPLPGGGVMLEKMLKEESKSYKSDVEVTPTGESVPVEREEVVDKPDALASEREIEASEGSAGIAYRAKYASRRRTVVGYDDVNLTAKISFRLECNLSSHRRRLLDPPDIPGSVNAWGDDECFHRRRDTRRRAPVGATPESYDDPSIFTVAIYQEISGRVYTVGQPTFNKRFQTSDNWIIMRKCPGCIKNYQTMYYRRFINPSYFSPYMYMACAWNYNDAQFQNKIGVDFKIYSHLWDALNDENSWQGQCTYDSPGIGFPRECGGAVNQWNSIPVEGCQTVIGGQPVTFYILERQSTVLLRQPPLPPAAGMHSWFRSEDADVFWPSAVGYLTGGPDTMKGQVSKSFDRQGGASSDVRYLQGNVASSYRFGTLLNTTFSICSVTRYTGTTWQGRILVGSDTNWFHGHWQGHVGISYYDEWIGPQSGWKGSTNWEVTCSSRDPPSVFEYGNDITETDQDSVQGIGINFGGCCWATDTSDWAVMELIVYNRKLSPSQLQGITSYLLWKLEAGSKDSGLPEIQDPAIQTCDATQIPQLDGAGNQNLVAWFKSENASTTAWYSSVYKASPQQGLNWNQDPLAYVAREAGYGARKPVQFVTGFASTQFSFGYILNSTSTVCSVTRYTGLANQGNILVGGSTAGGWNQWLHGHWNTRTGVAMYDNVWRSRQWNRNIGTNQWIVLCGSNGGGNILHDGLSVSAFPMPPPTNLIAPLGRTLAVNMDQSSASDFAIMEVLVWNRQLSNPEMKAVTKYLQCKLRTGV